MNTEESKKPTGPSPILSIAKFAFRALRNQWRLMILPLLFGIGLAVGAGLYLGKQSWEASGVMMYTPLPIPESQKGLFQQHDLQTLVSLVKSPSVMASVREELDLEIPIAAMDKFYKVTAPRNQQAVTVTVQWAEANMAARMTNTLMERYIDQIREYRRKKANDNLQDYQARLADCDKRFAAATKEYHEFFRTHNLFDARDEQENTKREVEALLQARFKATRTEPVMLAQRERLRKDLNELRKKEDAEVEASKAFDAAQDTVSDSRRRQDRLRELIEDEKQRNALMTQLTLKQKEYRKRLELRERGAESQGAVEALAAEIEVLTTKLTDSEQVRKWKEELTQIDKIVVPNSKGNRQGSPIVTQTLQKQLELDLSLIGLQKELFEIERSLATNRRRQEELRTLLSEADGLQKEIDARSNERQQLSEQVVLFRRLHDQQAGEFTIISRANPGPYPVSSTRKPLMMAGFMLVGLLSVARIVRRQWLNEFHGGKMLTTFKGIPVLGSLTESVNSERQLATEVRRWQTDYGSVLLFTEANQNCYLDQVMERLTARLSARDERVLIIDCRGQNTDAPHIKSGLSNLLAFQAHDWDQAVSEGTAPGVEWLRCGSLADDDAMATQVMRDVISEARQRYSFILLLAPVITECESIDLLLPYTSGVVACLGRESLFSKQREALGALNERSTGRLRCLLIGSSEHLS
jgi:capsular polysaccharide biosynthesis protein